MASDHSDLPHRIFSYGTLKKGQPNHFHLADQEHGKCRFVGRAITKDVYPLIVATHWNLPFLLHAPGVGNHVQGEVYEVDDDLLKWMDHFEDHPDIYERTNIIVNLLPESSYGIKSDFENIHQKSALNKGAAANNAGIESVKESEKSREAPLSGSTPIDCWCYLLYKYPQALLQKEMYVSYDSETSNNGRYIAEDDDSNPDNIADALLLDAAASS